MKNKNELIWAYSGIVIGLAAIILSVPAIVGIELPAVVVRFIALIELIVFPFFAYSSVKKLKELKMERKE